MATVYFVAGAASAAVIGTVLDGYSTETAILALAIGLSMGLTTLVIGLTRTAE